MKKTIALLVMLLVLLPYQAAFAANVTATSVERDYFENYKSRVKEVREAQKSLYAALCSEISALTNKSKASTNNYNVLVKSKANKEQIIQAKAERDKDKKALGNAKQVCTKKVIDAKRKSNSQLQGLDKFKRELTVMIKSHLAGKDQQTNEQFNKRVNDGTTYINETFDNIIRDLKATR